MTKTTEGQQTTHLREFDSPLGNDDPKINLVIDLATIGLVTISVVLGLLDGIHTPTNNIPSQNMFPAQQCSTVLGSVDVTCKNAQ